MEQTASYTFRALIEPEEGGGYRAFVPLLRGIHTFGNTIEDAKKNVREAIICHVQGLLKDSKLIPQEEGAYEVVQTVSGGELALSYSVHNG